MKKRFFSFLILVLLTQVNKSSAQAQEPLSQYVSLTGTVLDPSGASVPDAIVTLRQGNGKVLFANTTDPSGWFRFEGVVPGSYVIDVVHKGFEPSKTRIKITTKPPGPCTIKMALARLISEVLVSAGELEKVSTSTSENRDAAAVDQSMLAKLPVFDQDYVATMSTFLDSSSIGTGGTQLIVDGMPVNNVGVTASAIQEVRINQNPYSAEYSRPGRGSIEVITKAKATAYHGTFNFIFRDSRLNARDPFSLVRPPEQRRIYEGVLTGPLGRSESSSFLLSGNRQEEDLESIVFAKTLSGIAQESVSSPKRNLQLAPRIIHQFSKKHTAFVQYNEWDYPSHNQGVGGLILPEAATDSMQWERELIFNDRFALSSHWLNQFQVLLGLERHATTSVSPATRIVVNGAFTGGGAQGDVLLTESHFQLNEIVSWSSTRHLVKFGLNVPDYSHRGIEDHTSFGGTFYFSSLQDYQAQHPYAFSQQKGSGQVAFLQKELGWFVMDDYRVRPNLSLSLGLRWNWQNYLHDNRDFAPRIAFAYGLGKSEKTVVRGGSGIFYDRTGANPLLKLLLHDGERLRSYLITNPGYPDPRPGGGSLDGLPTNVQRLDPSIREAYTIQYSIGVERQITGKTTAAVTYTGSRGIGLFRSRDINAPLGPDYLARPKPSSGAIYQIESSGRQKANSLDITLRGDLMHSLSGIVQYMFSRTDNNTGGINWLPANQYDLSGEWSRADFDQRHKFKVLENFNSGKFFSIGVAFSAVSGKPYSMTTGLDPYHTGLANARPDGVARNSLEGPGSAVLDLRLSRDFVWKKIGKDKGMITSFSLDAFNVLNHVNYTAYEGDLTSPFFGRAVSALPTRRMQFTVRLEF